MVSEKLVIKSPAGLHARPLSKFMKAVKSFKSEIVMVTPKGEVNCRSIVGLLGAAIKNGTEVELKVNGPDEAEALAGLVELLESFAHDKVEIESEAVTPGEEKPPCGGAAGDEKPLEDSACGGPTG
ncbi:MAG: HPr family phosphocarrier protein [Deltaproteobacteria bacterium]|jgi:phosphocarrier protein|nr:HPr family phosphocarrier protein [Deltaproteobacteria bacterium]